MNRNPFAPGIGEKNVNTQQRGFEGDGRGSGSHRNRFIHQSPQNQQHHTTQESRNPFAGGSSPQHQRPNVPYKHQQPLADPNNWGPRLHRLPNNTTIGTGRRNVFPTSTDRNEAGGGERAGGKHNVTSFVQQQGQQQQYQHRFPSTQQLRYTPNDPHNQQQKPRNPFVAGGVGAADMSNTIDIGKSRSTMPIYPDGGVDSSPHIVTNNDMYQSRTTGSPANFANKNPFARMDILNNHQGEINNQQLSQQQQLQHYQRYEQHQPQKMSAQNNVMLQHIDASVAIAGQVKADIELNFDLIDDHRSGKLETKISSDGQSAAWTSTVISEVLVSESSGTSSSFQDAPSNSPTTSCSSPFETLPERPPVNDPYGTTGTGTIFRAGFVPTVAPPICSPSLKQF